MVLRTNEREEAIQLLAMDPQVCAKLLTHYRKGSKVDVEALRGRFPSDRVPKKSSRWDLARTKLAVEKIVFWVALCWFPDFREFIEVELGQPEK